MKTIIKTYFLGIFLLLNIGVDAYGQTVIWTDDFQSAAPTSGIRSAPNHANTTDGTGPVICTGDYFFRTNLAIDFAAGLTGLFTDYEGTHYWRGEDLDGCIVNPDVLNFTGIDISGRTGLGFKGLFGARTTTSWEGGDEIRVEYQIDGGGYSSGIVFEPNSTLNYLGEDTDNNGVGDGPSLTLALAERDFLISGTGTTLDLRITCNVDGGGEEFAFDLFQVVEGIISVSFTAPADICVNAGSMSGLTGGLPAGGTYSGPGVTDNGGSYTFNPALAGVGTKTITYTQGGNTATDDVEVLATGGACPVCEITSFSIGTASQCGNTAEYSVDVTWVGGPDASISLSNASATSSSGDSPATTANGTATFVYAIGTDADISVDESGAECTFTNLTVASPVSSVTDFQPMEGVCISSPQITLPDGYTCAYEYLTGGTFAGTSGTVSSSGAAVATYPSAIADGDSGTVRYTITNPCGSTEEVDVSFICVSCAAENGTIQLND